MDCYIYYRVFHTHAGLLHDRIKKMQAHLASTCAIKHSLKRRPIQDSESQTWMEVYLGIPDNFETQLNDALASFKVLSLIDGDRHVERFMEFDL